MEMNTRLQVEHPVTEFVTGEDLVNWQFKIAAGEVLPLRQEEILQRINDRGWAIEARIYAENPSENFMPDSGTLLHLKIPRVSESVRVDAGFVEGDTISSAYDGMIAKLIVRGPTRQVAIQKLFNALQEYEIVGVSTNIEFLKQVCKSPAFIDGDVETNYIQKHYDELFSQAHTEIEAYAQAALGLLLGDLSRQDENIRKTNGLNPHGEEVGFSAMNERIFRFQKQSASISADIITVVVNQKGRKAFSISVTGTGIDEVYDNVTCEASLNRVTSYFPHARISTAIIPSNNGDMLTLFQHGLQTQLRIIHPAWFARALGVKEVTNSVLAPMPCKILRNEVQEGHEVEKDQALVVIESMKMETTIRSPQKAVVAKLVHKAGDICKAGTVLVLFEEEEER